MLLHDISQITFLLTKPLRHITLPWTIFPISISVSVKLLFAVNTNVRVHCFLVNLIGMSRPPCISALVATEWFLLFLRWLNDHSTTVFAVRYILINTICVYSYPVSSAVGFDCISVQIKLLCDLAERYSLPPKFGYLAFLFFCHHRNSTLLDFAFRRVVFHWNRIFGTIKPFDCYRAIIPHG